MNHTTDTTGTGDLLATGAITSLIGEMFTATFSPAHRVGNDSTAVLACTVTMPLSFEDAVAALWVAARNGTLREDMTGPDDLHAVVVYTLINHNRDVAAARRELDDVPDGSPEWQAAIQLTMAVVRAYGNGTAPPAEPTAPILSVPVGDGTRRHDAATSPTAGLPSRPRPGLHVVPD